MNCKLCLNRSLKKAIGADERDYYLCTNCNLISVSSKHFLLDKMAKERYLSHKNGIEFKGYVDFLNRAIKPALKYLTKEMVGLDYGCGHNPTLSKILESHGINCEDYDPFFVKHELNKKYDFIFSTEVFEHFFNPKSEIEKIINLLKPNGILVVMTERWDEIEKFGNWYYTRDPSHVAFYNNETFDYISRVWKLARIYDDNKRLILLRKK